MPQNREDFQAFLEALRRRANARSPEVDEDDERLSQWAGAIDGLCDAHPVNCQRRGEKIRGSIEIKSVNLIRGVKSF